MHSVGARRGEARDAVVQRDAAPWTARTPRGFKLRSQVYGGIVDGLQVQPDFRVDRRKASIVSSGHSIV